MSISGKNKFFARRRADYACEYCGVSEQNAGGELTIDHFRPQSKNGGDALDNLVYCCPRCNLYKGDFWVESPNAPQLWNPRRDTFERHFWQGENGHLFALTETGDLTIRILKLNRPQLIEYRRQQFAQTEERRLLEENEIAVEVLLKLNEEQREVIRTQQKLLTEQRQLLNYLLKNNQP
ncbi:MAG TPA: HNH endonuclease signature motif containing protein [Pyrinomonadaceae bacterium]|nr:HNH endonuclease signature motif containing protein [Pyrinomonadaceae bacterium]